MLPHLQTLFARELDALAREVSLYPDDASPWKAVPGCPNSGGNLVAHLVGNLRHFIGAHYGKTGYVRNRDLEFSVRGLSRDELLELIAAAKSEVGATLTALALDPGALREPFVAPGNRTIDSELWLMHLAVHLGYHLGQIDYHRRTVTGDASGADALPLQALVTT
jgi:hypothetical protein